MSARTEQPPAAHRSPVDVKRFPGLEPALADAARLPAIDYSALGEIPLARSRLSQSIALPTPEELEGVAFHDVTLRLDHAPPVTVRVYQPQQRTSGAAILDIHPGGFVLGGLDTNHRANLRLVRELGVVVISVDYRLAPETPFPGALEDCYAALCWLADSSNGLEVDADQIAVHGFSAGGGLAAGVALLARDRGGPSIAFQYLGAPQLDDRLETTSMREFVDTPGFYRGKAALSWEAYLGEGVPGSSDVSSYAAIARCGDLSGLPNSYIFALQYDPLRDEAIAFAGRLAAAGVTTELHLFPGAFHASERVSASVTAQRISAEELAVLSRALRCRGREMSGGDQQP